jgi:ubiquinone/menaquinone biosynthesis C-methylase UbiE
MKYDQTNIPAGYDRARDRGPEFVDLWMDVIASHVEERRVDTILDLGCGTGRFSDGLSTRFGARVIGLDPSEKMLTQAMAKRRSNRVHYARGAAEAIPVEGEVVDLVFMSMSFHHFRDPRRAAGECRRVLGAGGTVVVRTGTREQVPHYPYVPFFPMTRGMLQELLPDRAGVAGVFESAGFQRTAVEVIT